MNAAEAAQVLAYAAAVDPRLNTQDADQARARILAWSQVLDDVPADFAAETVTSLYRTERPYAVQPGEIRDRWLRAQAREEALARKALPAPERVPMPDSLRELRARLAEERAASGAPKLTRGARYADS